MIQTTPVLLVIKYHNWYVLYSITQLSIPTWTKDEDYQNNTTFLEIPNILPINTFINEIVFNILIGKQFSDKKNSVSAD